MDTDTPTATTKTLKIGLAFERNPVNANNQDLADAQTMATVKVALRDSAITGYRLELEKEPLQTGGKTYSRLNIMFELPGDKASEIIITRAVNAALKHHGIYENLASNLAGRGVGG